MLFIDEIHRLDAKVEEILYPALEDYTLDLMIGTGPGARSMKIPLKPFTLVAATTRAGLLTAPLRSRFGIVHRLDFYSAGRPRVHRHAARRASSACRSMPPVPRRSPAAAAARRASPTACCGACATSRRCAPTASITAAVARDALRAAGGGRARLRRGRPQAAAHHHRQVRRRAGGRRALAAAISEEADAIEDIYEPYLLQIGFLDRTPRGRVATRRAYEHFGRVPPREAEPANKKLFT